MKKNFKLATLTFCFLIGIFLFGNKPVYTEAASSDYEYAHLDLRNGSANRIKHGKYYFWFEGNAESLLYSKSKTGKGTVLVKTKGNEQLYSCIATNGKKVLYMMQNMPKKLTISCVTISNKKKTTYKTLRMNAFYVRLHPITIYGNDLYYELYDKDSYEPDYTTYTKIYKMNLKTKKSKRVLSASSFTNANGRYIYYQKLYKKQSTVPKKHYVYDCKTGKSRTLGLSDFGTPYLYGGKVYLETNPKANTTVLLRFEPSGSKKKTFKTIKYDCYSSFFKSKYFYFEISGTTDSKFYRLDLTKRKMQSLSRSYYYKQYQSLY